MRVRVEVEFISLYNNSAIVFLTCLCFLDEEYIYTDGRPSCPARKPYDIEKRKKSFDFVRVSFGWRLFLRRGGRQEGVFLLEDRRKPIPKTGRGLSKNIKLHPLPLSPSLIFPKKFKKNVFQTRRHRRDDGRHSRVPSYRKIGGKKRERENIK